MGSSEIHPSTGVQRPPPAPPVTACGRATLPAGRERREGVIAGIGFRTACAPEEIVALVRHALAALDLSPDTLAALSAPAARAHEAPLREAARILGVPVRPIAPVALTAVDPGVPTRSPRALAAYGVGSVAEAAALAATGADRLALPRIASPAATCALALLTKP